MADEQPHLWEPALTLLVSAALEHFFLVPGDLGIGHVFRYGLFFLEGWSTVGLVLRLRLDALSFASLNARTGRPRGIRHGYSSSLLLYRYQSSWIGSLYSKNGAGILGASGLL
jgi:hypothetical protein